MAHTSRLSPRLVQLNPGVCVSAPLSRPASRCPALAVFHGRPSSPVVFVCQRLCWWMSLLLDYSRRMWPWTRAASHWAPWWERETCWRMWWEFLITTIIRKSFSDPLKKHLLHQQRPHPANLPFLNEIQTKLQHVRVPWLFLSSSLAYHLNAHIRSLI